MRFINSFIIFFAILFFVNTAFSYVSTNFFRPYDINFRMSEWENKKIRLGVNVEYGQTNDGRDWDEHKVNALQLYNPSESSLGMLMGAPKGSAAYDLANYFLAAYGPATDDGVRGHFKLDGDYQELDLTFYGKYSIPLKKVPGNFEIFLYIPVRSMELKNVNWVDQTKNILNSDLDVKNLLTSDIKDVAQRLGDLNLGSWSKTGLSDIVFMLGWYNDFRQMKEYLKNVRITSRVGLSIPSGSKKDEDRAFSLPLWNDGAWSMPFSIGIDLDFVNRIKTGLEFEITF